LGKKNEKGRVTKGHNIKVFCITKSENKASVRKEDQSAPFKKITWQGGYTVSQGKEGKG